MRLRHFIARIAKALGLRRRTAFRHVRISEDESRAMSGAWKDSRLPLRQRRVYGRALESMHAGTPPWSFQVAAEATRLSGIADPSIVEVGCGSGYYSEVLSYMVSPRVRYVGIDYSRAMISLAIEKHGSTGAFCVADATTLPFAPGAFDVVLSGGVLLHVVDYRQAVAETRRVAKHWAVLHVVPCVRQADTLLVKKSAYGVPVMEVIFNLSQLKALLEQTGLSVRREYIIEPYPVRVVDEPAYLVTIACEVKL